MTNYNSILGGITNPANQRNYLLDCAAYPLGRGKFRLILEGNNAFLG
ncbi:MAG TPA: hypothetical protein GXZ87_06785 [Bacteroidales bacterium]|nr:hypothetical protein [Bacteroidales bacterium]